jgi:glutamine amidotransferase
MLAVIDYKAGNLTSVVKAFRYLGADDVVVTQSPEDVLRAEKIVLPGVGHFQATRLLEELGLTRAVREAVAKGAPFLGICVGLQWLYEGSTEAPETAGRTVRALPCPV